MKVLRDSIIYLGSSIVNKAIPFLLLPVMTTYLDPEEYGLLSIYLILITFYSAFIGMNINVNISKNFFTVSKVEMGKVVYNSLLIVLVASLIGLVITGFLALGFKELFSIPMKWWLLIPFLSLMFMVITLNLTLLRNEERPLAFGLFEISNTALSMGFTILFLVSLGFGWYSQVLGTFIGYGVIFLLSLWHMKTRGFLQGGIDYQWVRNLLRTSLPMIPHVVGGIIMAVSDRLFIERMVDLEAVGIYSVGYTFGLVVILFTDAFIKAWSPWFFRTLSKPDENKKQKVVKYTYLYCIGVFGIAAIIALAAEWVLPYVVAPQYYDSRIYIIWIAMGYAVHGVYKILYPYMVILNKTSFLGMSSMVAAIVNLVLNYFLIDAYGAIGAAYATIISFGVSTLLVFIYQNKKYPMPWNLKSAK